MASSWADPCEKLILYGKWTPDIGEFIMAKKSFSAISFKIHRYTPFSFDSLMQVLYHALVGLCNMYIYFPWKCSWLLLIWNMGCSRVPRGCYFVSVIRLDGTLEPTDSVRGYCIGLYDA